MNAPEFKVYDSAGTYQAACKEPEAAAMLARFYYGNVRHGHDRKAILYGLADVKSPDLGHDKNRLMILQRLEDLRAGWRKEREAKVRRAEERHRQFVARRPPSGATLVQIQDTSCPAFSPILSELKGHSSRCRDCGRLQAEHHATTV